MPRHVALRAQEPALWRDRRAGEAPDPRQVVVQQGEGRGVAPFVQRPENSEPRRRVHIDPGAQPVIGEKRRRGGRLRLERAPFRLVGVEPGRVDALHGGGQGRAVVHGERLERTTGASSRRRLGLGQESGLPIEIPWRAWSPTPAEAGGNTFAHGRRWPPFSARSRWPFSRRPPRPAGRARRERAPDVVGSVGRRAGPAARSACRRRRRDRPRRCRMVLARGETRKGTYERWYLDRLDGLVDARRAPRRKAARHPHRLALLGLVRSRNGEAGVRGRVVGPRRPAPPTGRGHRLRRRAGVPRPPLRRPGRGMGDLERAEPADLLQERSPGRRLREDRPRRLSRGEGAPTPPPRSSRARWRSRRPASSSSSSSTASAATSTPSRSTRTRVTPRPTTRATTPGSRTASRAASRRSGRC